jgi:hypothetical protein
MTDQVKEKVRDLLKNAKTGKAFDEFNNYLKQFPSAGTSAHINTLQSSWKNGQRQYSMGLMTWQDWSQVEARTVYALLNLINEIETPVADGTETGILLEKSVFISYNHSDSEIAVKIAQKLKENGVKVVIDRENMVPGAEIKSFIEESVAGTDITVSLVSTHSLLSGWVAMETLYTLYLGNLKEMKIFIPCFLDETCFDNRFLIEATKKIDLKIAEIDGIIAEYNQLKLDSVDLNHEKSRLYALRNGLGLILGKIRGILGIDLRDENWDAGMAKLIQAIKN